MGNIIEFPVNKEEPETFVLISKDKNGNYVMSGNNHSDVESIVDFVEGFFLWLNGN